MNKKNPAREKFPRRLLGLTFCGVYSLLAFPAYAACTAPLGYSDKMNYNTDHSVLQFCNDQFWIGIGK